MADSARPVNDVDLAELFEALPTSNGPAWPAIRIGQFDMWLARNSDDMPVVLLRSGAVGGGGAPTVELVHVRATFGLACELVIEGVARRDVFSAIECRNASRGLQLYFLTTCGAVLSVMPPKPTPQDVALAIGQLVELFAAIDEAPKKTAEGLWGELALIWCSRDPAGLVTAWHALPEEKFDFASGRYRLEVKTTRGPGRRHHFSLEQLAAESRDVLVVSIAVEAAGGGESISDLVRAVSEKISAHPTLQTKMFAIVARTLGRNWDVSTSARFDLDLARRSTRFLDARQVPKVELPLPQGISEVAFVADCTSIDTLRPQELLSHGGLWASAAPA